MEHSHPLDKSTWTASNWNAYVVRQPTREARRAALQEVPEQWQKGVETHAKTVFALTAHRKRMVDKKKGAKA